MDIVAGVFLILHGLVHLLFAGQVLRFFELRPGMIWLGADKFPIDAGFLHLLFSINLKPPITGN